VADDYSFKLYNSMVENNAEYEKMIAEKVERLTGKSLNAEWQQCENTNSTYKACPVANFEHTESGSFEFTIAVHNPSSLDQNEVRIPIMHGLVNATVNGIEVPTSLSCNQDWNESMSNIKSCFATIKTSLRAHEITVIAVSWKKDGVFPIKSLMKNDSIEKNGMKVSFEDYSKEEASISFKIEQGDQKDEILTFSTRYWSSYIDYFGGS